MDDDVQNSLQSRSRTKRRLPDFTGLLNDSVCLGRRALQIITYIHSFPPFTYLHNTFSRVGLVRLQEKFKRSDIDVRWLRIGL